MAFGVGGQRMEWEDKAVLLYNSEVHLCGREGIKQDGTRLLHPTTAFITTHERTPTQIMSALQQARCCGTEMTVSWTTALPLQANIAYFSLTAFSQ